jgi:glycosyltransferase involved in cell wall biosynthesis
MNFPKKKENELNIFHWISENSGVGYYRQFLPALTLREKGIANVMINDFKWGEGDHSNPGMKLLFDIMIWADLVVVGRMDVGEFYAQWGGIREFFNIPVIIDTDDNVRHVRPTNPGYQGYYPGSEAITWNQYAISKTFDAVTVSTQDLLDFHKKENPSIYLLPNNLDVKLWDSLEKKNHNDGMIRLGFIGSAAHTEGIKMIKKPVHDIMEKHKNVKFLITHVYRHLFDDWSEELRNRIEFMPWIKLEDWPKGMKDLGMDIGLAPLADNMFNRAKSNLRWMEYSLCDMAVIASPVKPYLCIKDGIDGFLVKGGEEWYNTIEKLVIDKDLREKIQQNAHKRVAKEFDIEKNIGIWYNAYKEVVKKFHKFYGPKKRFVKAGKKYKQLI